MIRHRDLLDGLKIDKNALIFGFFDKIFTRFMITFNREKLNKIFYLRDSTVDTIRICKVFASESSRVSKKKSIKNKDVNPKTG